MTQHQRQINLEQPPFALRNKSVIPKIHVGVKRNQSLLTRELYEAPFGEIRLVPTGEHHNTNDILNNKLPWDGSHLGSHGGTTIIQKWCLDGIVYCGILLQSGWSTTFPGGIIYCTATCTKDLFPCIVEDIKSVFNIPRRGIHRITINGKEYIIYYVPLSIEGEVIWETPLSRLDPKHPLRKDPKFRKSVQRVVSFCNILALCSTSESSIRIRPGINGELIPINVNETSTAITKYTDYDYSIITKTLFSKWFGEETSIDDIVKDMVNYKLEQDNKIPVIRGTETISNNLGVISVEIRKQVENIIKRYDNNYVWYTCFIVDRMSRHLLIER